MDREQRIQIVEYVHAYLDACTDDARWGIILDYAGEFCQEYDSLSAAKEVHQFTQDPVLARRYLLWRMNQEQNGIRRQFDTFVGSSRG